MNPDFKFKPKLHSCDLEYYLRSFDEKKVESTKVYELARKLTSLAHPMHEGEYDKRWEYFYLPLKRSGRTIVVSLWIMEYKKEFYVSVHLFGRFHVKRGDKKTEDFYSNVMKETLRFVPVIKKDAKILQKLIPYDIRTGKIRGRYILGKLLSENCKKRTWKSYEKHLAKSQQISEISLNEYLDIAAICYRAAYAKKAENLSPLEMYKKWADRRDGGMLSIKDRDSKNEYSEWYHSGKHAGSHPFEIVFSWHAHGIHLYPPCDSSPNYGLRVTNYAYAWDFLKMVNALIKAEIPFEAGELSSVLDFLAGETYFTVNEYSEHRFSYIPSKEHKKEYFPHIEWDEIKVVRWKNRDCQ